MSALAAAPWLPCLCVFEHGGNSHARSDCALCGGTGNAPGTPTVPDDVARAVRLLWPGARLVAYPTQRILVVVDAREEQVAMGAATFAAALTRLRGYLAELLLGRETAARQHRERLEAAL